MSPHIGINPCRIGSREKRKEKKREGNFYFPTFLTILSWTLKTGGSNEEDTPSDVLCHSSNKLSTIKNHWLEIV
jgi:hypothetical protein